MSRRLTAALAVLVLTILLVPQGLTAAQGQTVRIRVWHGVEHRVSPSATVVAHYIWVAQTAAQVEDFMAHADITITVNDEVVFAPQPGKEPGWEAIEVSQLNNLARAQWTFPLPALEPGTHAVRTLITLDGDVSDGIEQTPFSGVVNDTTNTITVTGGAQDTQPAAQPAAAAPRTTARNAPPAVIHCDVVVGTFVKEAVGYWAPDPDKPIEPDFIVPVGKSMWTFGMDENYEYYQVMIDFAKFWVEADTLAPTSDEVWHNNPLPNCVVE